ncbi:MAG: helix-turn-helix transcriptional regulator [Nocardia sp.]|nr:helix-turn-helix transcriptional regulator [Nocardia sp.]
MAEHPNLHSISGGRGSAVRREPAEEPAPPPALPAEFGRPPGHSERARSAVPVTEPLWREVLGRRLRELRRDLDQTLAETAARAGISPQYLSEIERGRKEPSSEMIAALTGALGTSLAELATDIARTLRPVRVVPVRAPAVRPPAGPTLLARAA